MRILGYCCVLCSFVAPLLGYAQDSTNTAVPPDTLPTTVAKQPWRPRPGERFDFVFNDGFLLVTGAPAAQRDTVPANATSGTTFIGVSYNILFNPRLSLRFQPGVAFFKLNFNETSSAKTFPSRGDSTYFAERLRAFYFEVPIGLGIVLGRDDRGRIKTQAELGFAAGYRFNSSWKTKQDIGGHVISSRTDNVVGFANWRVGAYGKLMYKFIGLMGYYRFTDIFKKDVLYNNPSGGKSILPQFPRWEVGITLNF